MSTSTAPRPGPTRPSASPGHRPEGPLPHVVVVGGGIAGLSAAARLTGVTGDAGPRARVTLLESADRLGGKLRRAETGGVVVDLGAEAFHLQGDAALELVGAAGLVHELEPPLTTQAALWTGGALRHLPEGHLMGIPGDLGVLAASGVLSPAGLARACADRELPRTEIGEDISLGGYVAARMGREVVDRLVEPVLGGVYAGRADRISLRAALPGLFAAAREEDTLLAAVRRLREREGRSSRTPASRPAPPPFRGLRGGLGRLSLPVARACRAAGADIRTGTAVRALRRAEQGWSLTVRDALGDRRCDADAVVLAVPAPAAARLLAGEVPEAAAGLRTVEYADLAVVTLVFERQEVRGALRGSGFLVPPADGRLVKAATFFDNKWRWQARYAPDHVVVRLSVGRHGEDTAVRLSDEELVARSAGELAEATGLTARPLHSLVTRWPGGIPQYTVGHDGRVARVREQLAGPGTLAVCGAAYDGVGVPRCIESGVRAAEAVVAGAARRARTV
ncbi:protoporphyrinogen oxidase [Streptomyces nitrosporeus]|uniref:Coproporphyrinogen III oxidase n=1 Tax=Streptomyces nitrosporeus TaxID=28894 RepID=A0A5J6FI36_9ACTN|nr:protoporphyrinogen oxidase [Streptomyces nitrosporeus]QEU75701.1 protoporphyrinogen oxidase [Streptomyces nitrosporeus]GGY87354.1 protoporphyrinogen oxidase [Streptomyces nitrosporeus]